ncbi:MAG TPA: tetratricopeptide repeat protein [Methylophilaceae bacterium]|nr:tetratricopeptide repeat protein [Methylophilaceae bacterium]
MKKLVLLLFFLGMALPAFADEQIDAGIAQLQHAWAKAYYQTPEKQQEDAMEKLADDAHKFTAAHPEAAEPKIWEAIILASYAKAKGGLGALSAAKKSRDLLLEAEKINPNALNGSVYTSLGSLYYKVPGFPIGFGSKKKAQAYLDKALQLNPDGIDPNYFYADLMSEEGEYDKAVEYYKKALAAPPRPGREDADAGRRQEAEQGLRNAQKHLK